MAQLQTISASDTGRAMADAEDRKIRATMDNEQRSPKTISGGTVFSDATKGLFLSSDSSLSMADKYKNGELPYQNDPSAPYDVPGPDPDQLRFQTALQNDTQGRLIGSAPKVGVKTQLKMAETDGTSKTDGMGMTIAGQIGQTVGDTMTALENTSMNNYQNDMTYWESQGKYWFNPNSEIKPDLDKYLDNMPSAVDALRKSGMNAIQKGNSDTALEVSYNHLLNPAALKYKNPVASAVFNPLSVLDKKAGNGFAGYVSSQAIKGAAGGMSGGTKGIVVGALVGVVKGMFTWFAAKGEDAANAKKAQEAYEISLRDWTLKKNQRQIAEQEADYKNRKMAEAEHTVVEEAKKEKAEAQKLQRVGEGRAMLKSVIMNAGRSGQEYRDRRAAVKASRRV